MPNYIRARQPGGIYFFTATLRDRHSRLLTDHIDALRRAYRIAPTARPFDTVAMVVLPDHLHCIWRLPEGDADFATRWRHIKAEFSRRIDAEGSLPMRTSRRERDIWQRRFWEHLIRDERDLTAHIDYIHFNPVKHGHVARAGDWPHSTLHRFIRDGLVLPGWGAAVRTDSRRTGE